MDEYDPPKWLIDMGGMGHSDIQDFRKNQYRLKWDDPNEIALWLGCKALEEANKSPAKGIQYLRASLLVMGEEPPAVTASETMEDYFGYYGLYADILRRIWAEDSKEWARDHFLK